MPLIWINTQILHLAGSKTSLWHLISLNLQSPEENSLRISLLCFIPMFAACREQEQGAVQWPECFKPWFFAECYLVPLHRGSPFPRTVYGWGRNATLEWSSEVSSLKPCFLFIWTHTCCANHSIPLLLLKNALIMRFWQFFSLCNILAFPILSWHEGKRAVEVFGIHAYLIFCKLTCILLPCCGLRWILDF